MTGYVSDIKCVTVCLASYTHPLIYIHLNGQLRKEVYKTLHFKVFPDINYDKNIAVVNLSISHSCFHYATSLKAVQQVGGSGLL